ncbi:hypothetical protein NEAUS07_1474 [Nematocida ausubeli]|nr:hypothetical protein NEAUS07_1474 [Nematocida ausubeli]
MKQPVQKELTLIGKYIRERIVEMEISMQVRNVKEPLHISNESFEKKMRRKIATSGRGKRAKMSVYSEGLGERDLSSEEILESEQIDEEPSSEEKTHICTERKDTQRNKEVVPSRIPVPPGRKMKCGCASHGTSKGITYVASSSTATRRKNIPQ